VTNPRGSRKLTWFLLVLLLVLLAGLAARRAADTHLRAVSVLLRLSDPNAHGIAASFARHPFREELESTQTPRRAMAFRMYVPQDVKHPPAMVLLHGVHHLGFDEPRLVGFARALSGAGVLVMTPQLDELADYRVTQETIDDIGYAAKVLSARENEPVGVMGLSFAGGLALLAATRPEYSRAMGFVVAVGAHDDMSRVARFFAANQIEEPGGKSTQLVAHEYGVLVLAYSHLDHFFSAPDMPAAQSALRLWLWEQPQKALSEADHLSPPGKTEFDQLVHHREQVQAQLVQEIERHQAEMDAVSPHNHLNGLKTPVYLLHGAGDTVIPASETEWLAHDVPRQELKVVLISPALIHVNLEGTVPFSQKWELVDFLAKVLDATDDLGH
jgi:pimeloyl-ACP methyl ester carboxylesterase